LPNVRTFALIQKGIVDNLLHPDLKYNYLKINDNYNFVLDSVSYKEFVELNKTLQNASSKSFADDINLLVKESQNTTEIL